MTNAVDYDPNDDGLKAIFGKRFHDETTPPAVNKVYEQVDDSWAPKKQSQSTTEKMYTALKLALPFLVAIYFLFAWDLKGLMDHDTSYYTILALVGIVCFKVGFAIK